MKQSIALTISFFALCLSTSVYAITLDFSPIPENTAVTNQFVADGVTFRGIENGIEIPNVMASTTYFAGISNLTNCYPTVCSQRADVIETSFAAPTDNVSLTLDSQGPFSITFNAYDSGGVLLETLSATGDGVIVNFTASGISRIDMLQPNDSWAWGFSDLTFGALATSPTPIPTMSVWSLGVLVGLLGLIGYRRRKIKGL